MRIAVTAVQFQFDGMAGAHHGHAAKAAAGGGGLVRRVDIVLGGGEQHDEAEPIEQRYRSGQAERGHARVASTAFAACPNREHSRNKCFL